MNTHYRTKVGALVRLAINDKYREMDLTFGMEVDETDFCWAVWQIADYLPDIEALTFDGVDDAGLQAAAGDMWKFINIRSLAFHSKRLGNHGIAALCQSAFCLPNLESLNLAGTNVGNDGLKALALNAENFSSLKSLNCAGTRVSDAGLRAVARQMQHFAMMQSLDFQSTRVGDSGVLALAEQAKHLSSLVHLNFAKAHVSDIGLRGLATQASLLPKLQLLNFGETAVTDIGIEQIIAQAKYLPDLQSLHFERTQLTDMGLESLADEARHFPCIKILDFAGTFVTDRGLEAVAEQQSQFKTLQILNLTKTSVEIPQEILSSCDPGQIFEYVLSRARLLPEVKLLLVGQGEVGKTHLRKRLFEEGGKPTYHNPAENRTHDIEMTEWKKFEVKIQTASDNRSQFQRSTEERTTNFLCRVWDFGGQNHLHGSHRFFVGAERCFYILAINAGGDAETNRLDYWLRLLAHHGTRQSGSGSAKIIKRAPVIIVLTQCDRWEVDGRVSQKSIDLIEALAVAKKNDWYGANVVSCIDGLGWSDDVNRLDQSLQRAIELRHAEAAGRILEELQRHIPDVLGVNFLFPRGFFRIKRWIEKVFASNSNTKYFNWRSDVDFHLLCEEAGISEGLRKSYLAICRNLGLVHWVGDIPEIAAGNDPDLKELVFNPEWVKRPVYELIQSPIGFHERGWMSNERLSLRLPVPQTAVIQSEHYYRRIPFSERDRDHILGLMLACNVAFRVENRPELADGLLIPDLIEPLPRQHRSEWSADDVLRARHSLEFFPERVFLRFVANCYKKIQIPQRHCWRDEVIVPYRDRRTDTVCDVLIQSELSPPSGEKPYYDVSIRGGSRDTQQRILDKVFEDFELILKREDLVDGIGRPNELPGRGSQDRARDPKYSQDLIECNDGPLLRSKQITELARGGKEFRDESITPSLDEAEFSLEWRGTSASFKDKRGNPLTAWYVVRYLYCCWLDPQKRGQPVKIKDIDWPTDNVEPASIAKQVHNAKQRISDAFGALGLRLIVDGAKTAYMLVPNFPDAEN